MIYYLRKSIQQNDKATIISHMKGMIRVGHLLRYLLDGRPLNDTVQANPFGPNGPPLFPQKSETTACSLDQGIPLRNYKYTPQTNFSKAGMATESFLPFLLAPHFLFFNSFFN